MSDASMPRRGRSGFRIDMLWTDSRYRSTFFQIIALIVFVSAFFWLGSNAVSNLERAGKDFSFVFMTQPASYDINQVLIPYTNQSSHSTASVVGMLNTLLVAVLGCIAATVIGVLAGVARLSKNWIVARLMTVYIEAVRNVPLLLQILLWYAIFIESMPKPAAFRAGDAEMIGEAFAITNRGIYLPRPLFEAGSIIVVLTFLGALACAVAFGRWAKKYQQETGDLLPAWGNTTGFGMAEVLGILVVLVLWPFGAPAGIFGLPFGVWPFTELPPATAEGLAKLLQMATAIVVGYTVRQALTQAQVTATWLAIIVLPTVVVYYAMGEPFALDYPAMERFNFEGGIFAPNSLLALWLALSIYTGAFIAENVRAGILSVSKGQTEAAFALGLRPNRTMSLIILPQALRVIIPPLISQYLNLTKNSSLAIAVGYMDATGTLGGITLNQTGKEMQTILLLMAFYLSISLSISFVMNLYNENVKLVERTSASGFGFSFAKIFGGRWTLLRRGDAKMKEGYGVGGWLNLVVLFYLLWFFAVLNYVFVMGDPDRARLMNPDAFSAYLAASGGGLWASLQGFVDQVPDRMSYFTWSFDLQLAAVLVIGVCGATLAAAMLKGRRFIDLAVLELVVFLLLVFPEPLQYLAYGLENFMIFVGATDTEAADYVPYAPSGPMPLGLFVPDFPVLQVDWLPRADWLFVVASGIAIRVLVILYAGIGRRPNLTYLNRIRESAA